MVPPQGFQDEELLVTKRALEQAGVQVIIGSTRMGSLTGMFNGMIRADLLLNQVNLDNFNAVVFIGGVGTIDYLNNRILWAWCGRRWPPQGAGGQRHGPEYSRRRRRAKGARATAYLSEQARLLQGGAMYTGNPVEKDGLTITSTGPRQCPFSPRPSWRLSATGHVPRIELSGRRPEIRNSTTPPQADACCPVSFRKFETDPVDHCVLVIRLRFGICFGFRISDFEFLTVVGSDS